MPTPILLDLTHTSHTRARTGVQRVARALFRELSEEAEAVCFDPFECAWRPLEGWEKLNLASVDPSPGRGERWPLTARLRGRLRRWRRGSVQLGAVKRDGATPKGVIVPEIFSPRVAGALPGLFAASEGPRVALFHDAIALQFPEYAPRSTVARFPAYLRQLLAFDGIAANSEASRQSLLGYWRWLGVAKSPPVAVVSFGVDRAPEGPAAAIHTAVPTVLCVGSIEGRKNHAALLDACEILWSRGLQFRLRLVGLAHSETGASALERIRRLRSSGRPVDYDGPVGDDALEVAYGQCAFTVYPSFAEGFGLPVAESLSRGKPCICSWEGALGEIARDGGCLALTGLGAPEISAAIGRLIESPAELSALATAARARRFASWSDYAKQLVGWMATLERRP
jgi:glycosyltransferase involved in cell wall biosynthesis